MRTTIDLTDEAYHIAKTVAREQNRSLGRLTRHRCAAAGKGRNRKRGRRQGGERADTPEKLGAGRH